MTDMNILLVAAATLGFTHTVFGPDHYLPFIVMSKARKWTVARTLFTTLYCGLGHVAGSVIIGIIGIAIGFGIKRIEIFESIRGNLAGWAFFIFGFTYMVWGIFKAVRNRPHTHIHFHGSEETHAHEHTHSNGHAHVHGKSKATLTPWVLFIIFILGPCEILVPLLMYPAAQHDTGAVISVALLFSAVTVLTMCTTVTVGYYGLKVLPAMKIDRFMHAVAGATICLSGFAILFLDM